MAKILLVEDNEMNRDMLARRLTRNGFQVLLAVDGEQAVAMAASERPDVILMDIRMPMLDGIGAANFPHHASMQAMPGFSDKLSDGEAAGLANHLRVTFGGRKADVQALRRD